MKDNDIMSAYAFDLARNMEREINERTNNLNDKNKDLEARILFYYQTIVDKEAKMHYGDYFKIQSSR